MDLAQHFKDEEKPLFQDIPKIHPVLHSALASGYINPRLTWCFRQEDNMNVHRTLAKSRCKGLQGPLVTAKLGQVENCIALAIVENVKNCH